MNEVVVVVVGMLEDRIVEDTEDSEEEEEEETVVTEMNKHRIVNKNEAHMVEVTNEEDMEAVIEVDIPTQKEAGMVATSVGDTDKIEVVMVVVEAAADILMTGQHDHHTIQGRLE